MLTYQTARARIIEVIRLRCRAGASEPVDLVRDPFAALGRVLAEDVFSDRNYPPFRRSIRDGFACRAADVATPGANLRLIGESRTGVPFAGDVSSGACVRIFTGAAVPPAADAVVMQEYAEIEGDRVAFSAETRAGQYVVEAGAELRQGDVALRSGSRLGYAETALAAQLGHSSLRVHRRPRIAILSTGDEIVPVEAQAGPFQMRDSNSVSLAAQIAASGGDPVPLGNVRDEKDEMRMRIGEGLSADALVLSGGVSVGKYDFVEAVLRDLGAEFFFDCVAIRPGKPAVFGWCGGKPVFGLPGNPVSTMVTFELLVAPAVELLGGAEPQSLPLFRARLAHAVEEKAALAHFLPARVSFTDAGPEVEVLPWHGSGDVRAVAQSNCFLVLQAPRLRLVAGDWADVLPRRGFLL